MCHLLSLRPAQIGLACCQCLIQPSDHCCMWGRLDDLWMSADLFRDLPHDAHEVVEGFAGLGLGWLDHHGFVYDEREVDGWGVHAKVEDALGDVQCRYAVLFSMVFCCCHKFVLACLWVSDLIIRCQLVFEIIGVENCTLGNMTQT